MSLATIVCIDPPAYSRRPHLTIPNLGPIEAIWDAVNTIPDPMEIITKFMDSINLALAPVRKYLQMVEAVIAIKQCIEALPKAIMTLSPQPIFDCIKALVRAFAVIIQDIPPIPYIQMAMDVMSICIDLINAIITVFERLDQRITALLNLLTYAQNLGDIDLITATNCSIKELKLSVRQLMDMMMILKPINDILMSVFLRLIPTPEAQKAANDYALAAVSFSDAAGAMDAGSIAGTLGLPPMGPVFQALTITHNALAIAYNVLAPWIGEDANKTPRAIPSFNNL